MSVASDRPYIFDASRLIWRLWRGRLPTGIDRVCLAYLEAYADSSLALIQWKDQRFVLTAKSSDKLFQQLLHAKLGRLSRKKLIALLAHALPTAILQHTTKRSHLSGKMYLNVGHTGLHIASLPQWLSQYGLKRIHLIHDLIPITHPQFCRAGEQVKHSQRIRHALQDTTGIILNSEETAKQLRAFAEREGLETPPLLVAHLGIESLDRGPHTSTHPRPYFLCIGTIEARKNHIILLKAWQILREKLGQETPDLILVGQRGWEAEETLELLDTPIASSQNGQIIELPHCSDNRLGQWIDGARAVLMPSHVEGYGLPVLETLSKGVPVIASDLDVYAEIARGLPLLVNPNNAQDWAHAVENYLSDEGDRNRQIQALETFSAPTWNDHMSLVEPWIKRLAEGS